MIVKANKEDLVLLYNRAKKKYQECINYKENEYLKAEINVSLKSIVLSSSAIKIIFSEENSDSFHLKIYLDLYANNKVIGRYVCIENEKGEIVDDSLDFLLTFFLWLFVFAP